MPTNPFTHTATMTGTGEETLNISPQYLNNVITITGLAVGTVTIRAMEYSNTVLERVVNGTMRLDIDRTCIIEGVQLRQIGITVEPNAAYTVKVRQYNPIGD